MSLLITYILLTFLAAFWIARDAETIYIFDVYGKNFRYVWNDSPYRWSELFRYGLRLLVILSLVMFNMTLSCRFFATNPLRCERVILLLVVAFMLSGSCAIIPWIYLAHHLRYERFLRAKTLQLSHFINRVIVNGGFTDTMQHAEYATDEGWTVWHPKCHDQCWDGIVPVAYIRNEPISAALFPVDWETFLAWNAPANLTHTKADLPFCGACETKFRVRSFRHLRGCANWTVIETDLQDEWLAELVGRG